MSRLNAASPGFYTYKYARDKSFIVQTIYQQTCFLFQSIVVSPRSSVSFQHLSLLRSFLWSCGSNSSLRFRLSKAFCVRSLFMIVRHIFEISDDSRMRITTKSVHDKNDDFALRYVRIYPGVIRIYLRN